MNFSILRALTCPPSSLSSHREELGNARARSSGVSPRQDRRKTRETFPKNESRKRDRISMQREDDDEEEGRAGFDDLIPRRIGITAFLTAYIYIYIYIFFFQ